MTYAHSGSVSHRLASGTLALWFLRGLFDSTLIYFFALLAWADDGIAWHGRAAGLAVLGNTIAIAALLVVLGRMAFAIHTWTILLIFGFAWSVASFVGAPRPKCSDAFARTHTHTSHTHLTLSPRRPRDRELDVLLVARAIRHHHPGDQPDPPILHRPRRVRVRRLRGHHTGTQRVFVFALTDH